MIMPRTIKEQRAARSKRSKSKLGYTSKNTDKKRHLRKREILRALYEQAGFLVCGYRDE